MEPFSTGIGHRFPQKVLLLWLGLVGLVSVFSSQGFATEPVSISFIISSDQQSEPSEVVTLSLTLVNNTNTALRDVQISLEPSLNMGLNLKPDQAPLAFAEIPAFGSASGSFVVRSTYLLPSEKLLGVNLWWIVTYPDESRQTQILLLVLGHAEETP